MKAALISRFLVAVLSLGLCAALSRPPPRVEGKVSLEILPNPLVIKVLGRSQLDFVADLFWVRMANMAGRAVSPSECGALLPIGNLIADLAPRFRFPYFVGGTLAPVRQRDNTYVNVEGALSLMSRGAEAVPDYVRLHVQKAYTELDLMHDTAAAGQTLRKAAQIPGAPAFLSKLATRLLAESGNYDEAREFARAMASSDDPQLRADFEYRLKQIDLEQVLARVEAAAQEFVEAEGRPAERVEELVTRGFLQGAPVDPFGGTIELTQTGARSTVESSRLRAHAMPEW